MCMIRIIAKDRSVVTMTEKCGKFTYKHAGLTKNISKEQFIALFDASLKGSLDTVTAFPDGNMQIVRRESA